MRPRPFYQLTYSLGKLILALIIGSVWTAFGYWIAWAYVLNSMAAATIRLPASFLTSGVGCVITLFLVRAILRQFKKH